MITMTTIQLPIAFFANYSKNHPISNACWDHNFQLQDLRLCKLIDLSLLISKIKFLWGWECQIQERDKWKNMDKTRKMLNFPGFEKEFLPFVLE